MNRFIMATAGLTLLFAAQDGMACDYPEKVDIPDGSTASKDEMIAGQRGVKDFVATMEAYLDCLIEEEKQARAQMDELSAEDEQLREDMLNKKYNAAVDEMEKVAAQFNSQVQAFKNRDE